MRSFKEIYADARDESPFSNSTEGDAWTANWCSRCINDDNWEENKEDGAPLGCPILCVAYLGMTPVEWLEQDRLRLGDQYHCVEFRDRDDPGAYEPEPMPDPPGQYVLMGRDGLEGVRMLVQVELQESVSGSSQ